MGNQIIYTTASTERELNQIIALQKENLRHTKSMETEAEMGFVTVSHDIDLLRDMNREAAHVIAKDGDSVVAYALAMTRDFKEKIPILKPMFDLLENIEVDGQKLGANDFLVMGQICVDERYRGKGIFKGLYDHYFDLYIPLFGRVITEVAERNSRSLHAHLKVGFKEIHRYPEHGFEDWVVVKFP